MFTSPLPNSIFDIYNPYGIKLLTRFRSGLSHLHEHEFKNGFNGTINAIYICGGEIVLINHFFLHCPEYCKAKETLFDNIKSIEKTFNNVKANLHLLAYFFTGALNATPTVMYLSSTRQLISYYLQEDSMDLFLTKLKMFLILFLFILFCYFLIVLIPQVSVTFYIGLRRLLVLL